jgi:quinone-modifying oxidoreductase subunit QmoA
MEDFYTRTKAEENVQFFKGKVAQINQDEASKKLMLKVEDTMAEALHEITADLVVLATGMQPNTSENPIPVHAPYDDYGFVASQVAGSGIYASGCTRTPTGVQESVQDGTAAALKAIQSIARR